MSDLTSWLHEFADACEIVAAGRWPGPRTAARLREVADALAAAKQQGQAVAECHCATCTCAPGMTPAVRFDTSPAAQEGAIRDHLIALGWTPPGAQQPAAVDEAAAIRAFEEHFQASSDDPYFEGELELWLTAWRKALAAQRQEPTT